MRGKKLTPIKPRLRDDFVPETPADVRVRESLKECLRQAIEEERKVVFRYLGNKSAKVARKSR